MKRGLVIISLVYGIAITFLTAYWATNFNKYVHYKGDEIFSFVEILFASSYVLMIILQMAAPPIKWLLALLLPVLITIISFFIGFFVLIISNLGTSQECIMVYGLTFVIATLFSVYTYWWGKLIT